MLVILAAVANILAATANVMDFPTGPPPDLNQGGGRHSGFPNKSPSRWDLVEIGSVGTNKLAKTTNSADLSV